MLSNIRDDERSTIHDEIAQIRKELRRKEAKRRVITRIVIFGIALLALFSCVLYVYVSEYMPNSKTVDFYEYFTGLDTDTHYIVFGSERMETGTKPVIREGGVFIPVSFVEHYIDPQIFWDSNSGRLSVTTKSDVIRIRAGELDYTLNDNPSTLLTPVYDIYGEAFLPSELLTELYDITITYSDAYKMITIDLLTGERIQSSTKKETELRYEPDIKSPIQTKLSTDTVLTVYESEGDFVKARTKEGLVGYVPAEALGDYVTLQPVAAPVEYRPHDTKLNVVFDQIGTFAANSNENKRIVHDGLDVLVPTWFSFNKDNPAGDIISIADRNYVEWAHGQGYEVWALITDNFDSNISSAVLRDTETRENVIRQLTALVIEYGLDGINIDYEMVREEDSAYYVQFIRELAPFLRALGSVLSVDMYVPAAHNMYYNRTEVGKAADYIVIMAYDEHWATSPVSGPNASIGFVEAGIVNTLNEVPKEKILLGLPYYVRVWTETSVDGSIKATSSAYSMDYAYRMFNDIGAPIAWDREMGSYYSEYTEQANGTEVRRRVWLEEERSIEEKLKLVVKYDISGVAGWKRNLEKDVIWDLIKTYIKE